MTRALPAEHVDMAGDFFAGYYDTARTSLLDLLVGRPEPAAALEIGCGAGANLAELKRRHPGLSATGVEIEPQAAEIARQPGRADHVLCADVLDPVAVDFPAHCFDLIVLSHVLEHFAQPERVLGRCRRWLAPSGCLLIALPNLRHAFVLRQLVFQGEFRYADAGILDRTHLRFFTRRSALRFIAAEGWQVQRCAADIEGRPSRWLDRASLGMAREFAAVAYNFLAVRAG